MIAKLYNSASAIRLGGCIPGTQEKTFTLQKYREKSGAQQLINQSTYLINLSTNQLTNECIFPNGIHSDNDKNNYIKFF